MIEALKGDEIAEKMGGRFKLCALIQRRLVQLMQGARDAQDRGAVFGQLNELRRQSTEQALGVLTDEQKPTWEELTGEPFELGFGGPGGRPGGGPPPARD